MIVVTGATGKLGRLVVESLLTRVPARDVAVAVRSPERARDLAERGVSVRRADYTVPSSLDAALEGADKVLLISSNAVGARVAQHATVIAAARRTRAKLVAYTSILHADTATHALASEHRETERQLRAAELPFVLLRNGWYFENYTAQLAQVRAQGAFAGSAGHGRISAAARADFADAAAVVLTEEGHEGKAYELAGDAAFTMDELAREVARQTAQPIAYRDLPEAEYAALLQGVGLPSALANVLASADAAIARGELHDTSSTLSRLLRRPTTPLQTAIQHAL